MTVLKFESLEVRFDVAEDVRRLPGAWLPDEYRRLLALLDVAADGSDADLADLALMALQDLEPEEAMALVLIHFTDNLFSKGQVQHLCEELKEVRAWEEYSELDHQRALYVCVDLLHAAFPQTYPEPAARKVQMTLTANRIGRACAACPIDPATVLRVVGRCQKDSRSVLNRFFADQIGGAPFPEAVSVIWHLEWSVVGPNTLVVLLYGAGYWFRGLEDGDSGSCCLTWPATL